MTPSPRTYRAHVNAERLTGDQANLDELAERLYLADWRRRTAELYATVRELAALDPRSAWEHWRRVRERMYREHPSSPVPAAERSRFLANHFAYDPDLRFEVALVGATASAASGGPARERTLRPLALGPLPVSTGDPISFERIGWVEVPLPGGARRLAVFWLPEYASGIFLPFRDGTNGAGTYAGGRYLLDAAKGADLGGDPERRTLTLDFNFAYQPSCAFDAAWSCPLSPPENRLDVEIRAGERLR